MDRTTKRFNVGGASRPVCALCDKAYGQRATRRSVILLEAADAEPPPHQGNEMLVCEEVTRHSTSQLIRQSDGAKCRTSIVRETWDGETWFGGYQPFCTLRCAVTFARAAYRDGARYKLTGKS